MKHLIYFLVLYSIGCSSIPYDPNFERAANKEPIFKSSFEKDKEKLPSKCIIIDHYLEKTNNIFFINKDYIRSYSQLIEYNLNTNSVVNEIISLDGKTEFIDEYGYSDTHIVYSVIKKQGKATSKDIYAYNIDKKEAYKIASNIIYGDESDGTYPLSLKISKNRVAWIEHNLEKELTIIKLYDLNSRAMKIINTSEFIDDLPNFKMPTFILELKNDTLFYDKRQIQGAPKIFMYDIRKAKITNELLAKSDILFHFSGSYNEHGNYLSLYARSNKEDLIYIYDLKENDSYNIVGFYPHTLVYDDRINTRDNFVIYNVQMNVSGDIIDHYFGEIYNITTRTMKRYKYAIDIVETDEYFGVLRFDRSKAINKINFELYKKKNNGTG